MKINGIELSNCDTCDGVTVRQYGITTQVSCMCKSYKAEDVVSVVAFKKWNDFHAKNQEPEKAADPVFCVNCKHVMDLTIYGLSCGAIQRPVDKHFYVTGSSDPMPCSKARTGPTCEKYEKAT